MLTFYLTPALLGLLGVNIDKNNKRERFAYLAIAYVVLCLLVGLRAPSVGNDTGNYMLIFRKLQDYDNFFEAGMGLERGYVILMRLIGLVTDDAQVMLFIVGALTLFPVFFTVYKYSKNVTSSVLIFLFSVPYINAYTGMRAMLCTSVILLTIGPLIKRQPIRFILLTVIAGLIHNVGYVFLIVYPLTWIRWDRRHIIWLIVLSIIAVAVMPYLLKLAVMLEPRYESYLDEIKNITGYLAITMHLLIAIVICMAIYCTNTRYRDSVLRYDVSKKYLYKTRNLSGTNTEYMGKELRTGKIYMLLMVLALCSQIIEYGFGLLARITMLFINFAVLAVPQFVEEIKNKDVRSNYYGIVIIALAFRMAAIFIARPEWYSVLPYEFFFME